jgi:acyl transferase domain-containing protein
MGITTPNPDAQRELIETAIADAGISPETISYVEAHGTGTLIGDPIELKALTKIFTKHTSKKQFCGVGSVKTNLGHLLSAAGAAGIIKVLLAISQQELPPTLHCKKPNPRFNFEDSPLYLVQGFQKWTQEDNILRAGISAFGLGGNNAHIIVSNEGIPSAQQASLEPKGQKVIFNRKRYWPERSIQPGKHETIDAEQEARKEHQKQELGEFFDVVEV